MKFQGTCIHAIAMFFMALSISSTITTGPCFAYSIEPGGGIATPAFDARPDLGIPMGAFMVHPRLTAGMEYNDNIYATKNDKESDWIATAAPRILAASTWACHSLKLDAGIEKGFYLDESNEDYLNAHAFAGGRLNILRTSYLELKTGYENYYEDRGSPDAQEIWEEPARFERLSAAGQLHHGMGRFTIDGGGGAAGYIYKDVDLIGGGTQNQDIRDYISYDANLRVGYEWFPTVQPFIKADYNWRRYDEKDEAGRDSDGYRVGAGTQLYMGGITTGEIWGGYMRQEYDYENRDDISGAWYGLALIWDATRLTSVRAGVERTVNETSQAGASGYTATITDLTIRHAFLRNLSGSLGFSHKYHDYEGVDITDKYYTVSPGLSYMINKNLSADLRYEHTKRDSSQNKELREYAANCVMLSITGEF